MKYEWLLALLIALSPVAAAGLELDAIRYDPTVIASGDEVDIIVQFHHEVTGATLDRVNNPDYAFSVRLEPDDDISRDYVQILDATGDDVRGMVLTGGYYNKRFRVKIDSDAPAANYEFRLTGIWEYQGQELEDSQFLRFQMPVKKQGIVLGLGTQQSTPADVRPGDAYVNLQTVIYNSGEKRASDVEIQVFSPEGITPSYSNNNRIYISDVMPGESALADIYIDVNEDVEPGVYDLVYEVLYRDEDRNEFAEELEAALYVRERPDLQVETTFSQGTIRGEGVIEALITNTGTEEAEFIDARLLLDSAQPFTAQRRSEYIGTLAPGESSPVRFTVDVHRDAELREYDLTLILRAKGDTDKGNDNIYSYNRNVRLNIDEDAPNTFLYVGAGIFAALIIFGLWRKLR